MQARNASGDMTDDLPKFHPVDVSDSVEDVGDISDLEEEKGKKSMGGGGSVLSSFC